VSKVYFTQTANYSSLTELHGLWWNILLRKKLTDWLMPGFHHSVAVLPLPFRRCRYTNSVSAVRIALPIRKKNPSRRCRSHLPLCRNCRSVAIGSNPIFAVLPLVDNQSAFWSLHPYVYGKTFPAIPFSRATATAAMKRKNGNGTLETRHRLRQRWRINLRAPLANIVDGRLDDGGHGGEKHDPSPHELTVAVTYECWELGRTRHTVL